MASRAATPPVAVRKARRFILRRLYSPHLEKGSRSPDARTAFEATPRPLRLRDASATLEKPHSWTAASSESSLCTQGQICGCKAHLPIEERSALGVLRRSSRHRLQKCREALNSLRKAITTGGEPEPEVCGHPEAISGGH